MKFFSSCLQFLCKPFRRPKAPGKFVGRRRTLDATNPMVFKYRMGAGFPGDINRTRPFDVEPCLPSPTLPPLLPGVPVVSDPATNSVRRIGAGDGALTAIYGVAVRAFPVQSTGTANAYDAQPFGVSPLPVNQTVDVLRKGYIQVKLSGAAASAKGSPVFVWFAASAGSHVQGGFEAVATAGSTFPLDAAKTSFNGPADADGNVELAYNI